MKHQRTTFLLATATLLLATASPADPAITGVTAQQRHPWNGKVDISYTASGIDTMVQEQGLAIDFKVTATDRETGTSYTATFLSGDMGLADGTHSLVWDMDAQGLLLKSTNVVFSVSCETPTPPTYCVIDLSGGSSASSYPVTYLSAPPSGGFNVDEYKTTKLVLKRIEAGTFIMGENQSDEAHRVTLTKPFYMGLFEMTQKQYQLVTGNNPSSSSDDTLPVERVSYNDIRGASNGSQWPASNAVDDESFLGKLRARTGLDFDLPTEAQWEYACRAGTTTRFSYGDSSNGEYMWWNGNKSSGGRRVGTKLPNPWGLYDMHGDVGEWCLDWYASSLSGGVDPMGPSSGSDRAYRPGNYYSDYIYSYSYARSNGSPSSSSWQRGFRLSRSLTTDVFWEALCSGSSEPTTMGPSISGVTAQQRYPWNGKVDISYTASDIAIIARKQGLTTELKVTATDQETGTSYTAMSLSGDIGVADGTHNLVWDLDAQGLTLKSTNVVFSVSCETAPATYCVIDLSSGSNSVSYPVTYLAEPPSGGFNVDEYKTTKLVLKRIEAGTFIMGENQSDEAHRVTLTKPFYMGLFEMTQKQYQLVTGNNPSSSSDDTLPVERVSYNDIRGASNGSQWPASNAVDDESFLGKLRARTGLDFDLPTEAQWEYACRAGTTTRFSYGDSSNGEYMWWNGNKSSGGRRVGTKLPNPWGLYDMHGDVGEWCLDWYASSLSGGMDPKGPSSGSDRAYRPGNYVGDFPYSYSYARSNASPSSSSNTRGFRLVRTLNQ